MLDIIFSWSTLWWFMILLYVPSCFGLIVIVLLQKGKGAGFGGAFGVGPGSDTVFGPRMAKSLPQRLTYIMAGVFMVFALAMSVIGGKVIRGTGPGEVEDPTVQAEAYSTFFGDEGEEAPAAEPAPEMESTETTPPVVVTPETAPAPEASAPETSAPETPKTEVPAAAAQPAETTTPVVVTPEAAPAPEASAPETAQEVVETPAEQ